MGLLTRLLGIPQHNRGPKLYIFRRLGNIRGPKLNIRFGNIHGPNLYNLYMAWQHSWPHGQPGPKCASQD